tara:strand:+ start:3129 stop:5549 length:2421 start_codon:yes stop_codon:yes gene_type:complete
MKVCKSMIDKFLNERLRRWSRLSLAWAVLVGVFFSATVWSQDEVEENLIERLEGTIPYDEITVKAEDDTVEVIQLELLDIPGRGTPELKTNGKLEIRLLGNPDDVYEVFWRDITKIRLYEDIMIDEINGYIDSLKFDEAFDYLLFLRSEYSNLPGTQEVLARYQYSQGADWLKKGRNLEALSLLESLYENFPEFVFDGGPDNAKTKLNEAAQAVLKDYLDAQKIVLARRFSQRLIKTHGVSAVPAALDTLRTLRDIATGKRDEARRLLDEGKLREAQKAVREMIEIFPQVSGGREIAVEAIRKYPLVTVGTIYPSLEDDRSRMDNWAARRTGTLTRRMIMEYEGPGTDRGEYTTPFGDVKQGSDRKTIRIRINPLKLSEDNQIYGFHLAERLLKMAEPLDATYNAQWASIFERVEVTGVFDVVVHLQRPHVLPEAMLQVFLDASIARDSEEAQDGPFIPEPPGEEGVRYVTNPKDPFPVTSDDPNFIPPSEVLEIQFEEQKDLIKALRKGDVDVVDRLSPVTAIQLSEEPGSTIKVVPYALPTIHMLVPNYDEPYMKNDLFRRAILYGIMREATLNELILKNRRIPGCQVVSGPFSPGMGVDDPLSYAYNRDMVPRPYAPHLAVVLTKLAEQRLQEQAEKKEEEPPPIPELVIGYPAEDDARVACTAFKFQLEQLEVFKVKLVEFEKGQSIDTTGECNLTYMKVAMWEPIVDTARLISPNGIAAITDDHVNRSVQWMERAIRWPEVRNRVRQVHRIAHEKAAVLPLWQLREYFAHREGITLGTESPVSLYHGIQRWQLVPNFEDEE